MKKDKKIIHIIMYMYLVMFGFEKIVLGANTSADLSCTDWGRTLNDLQNIFNFMKIIIPLLVIGLSTYDFIKAVTAKEEKGVKKAFQIFLKRMIYAVIFFFLPVLLELLLKMLGKEGIICIE